MIAKENETLEKRCLDQEERELSLKLLIAQLYELYRDLQKTEENLEIKRKLSWQLDESLHHQVQCVAGWSMLDLIRFFRKSSQFYKKVNNRARHECAKECVNWKI